MTSANPTVIADLQVPSVVDSAELQGSFQVLSHKYVADTDGMTFLVARSPPTLRTIPPELRPAITRVLDPVSSACLGVTCKAFYDLHRVEYGSVWLKDCYDKTTMRGS